MTSNPHNRHIERHLREGEALGWPQPFNGLDLTHTIFPVVQSNGQEGNTVFLEMERQGNAVEAVELTGDVVLSVRAVEGTGLLVKHDGETGEIEAIVLSAGEDMDDTEAVELRKGDSYAYLNVGRLCFVVRDDCTPAFKPEYEVPATNEALLETLGRLGIFEYQPK